MGAAQNRLNQHLSTSDPRTPPPYDHASSDEIRRDIDRTRHEMDHTLEELETRLHPRHLLDDVLDLFRSGGPAHVSRSDTVMSRTWRTVASP